MRLNGDPYWRHDDECSLDNPCPIHQQEEEDRANENEMARQSLGVPEGPDEETMVLPATNLLGDGRVVEGQGGGSNPPSPPACKRCGQVRAGTPWRASPYIRDGELVWLCQPCVNEEGA